MALHLAAYIGNAGTSDLAVVAPVPDPFLSTKPNGFVLPSAMKVVAAYATARTLLRARISAPSLRRLGYPYIRPMSHSIGEDTDPNVMHLVRSPLLLPESEVVSIEALASSATGEEAMTIALLWLCDEITPLPPGEPFCMRFSMSSSAPTVGLWSSVGTVSFDQKLPPGTYAVIGFEHWSRSGVAARLSFPGQKARPGVLSTSSDSRSLTTIFPADVRPDRLFHEGGLGVYGTFDAFAPPSLEVFAGDESTAHEGYLTLVRVG